jgi:hypothetical protein
MEPVHKPLNTQILIEAQSLEIAVLQAQIAACQALRFTVEHQSPLRRPRHDIHRPDAPGRN